MTSKYPPPPKSTLGRFDLPGFSLPINWAPNGDGDGRHLFDTALSSSEDTASPMITLRELTMMALMNEITDKPEWERKIFDKIIVARWRAEMLAQEDRDITKRMVAYVIAELRYRSEEFKKTGLFWVYYGDVVKSDTAVPESLREALQNAVAKLENVPEYMKDWHPNSNDQVLDLVHPSLFPLIYGTTRILPDSIVELNACVKDTGNGVVIPVPPEEDLVFPPSYERHHVGVKPYSKNFQWLPCEVDISSPDIVKITSYINNLHPKQYPELYSITEKVISAAIPLWNATLTRLKTKINVGDLRIPYEDIPYDAHPDEIPYEQHPKQEPNETDQAYDARYERWTEENTEVRKFDAGIYGQPYDLDFFEEEESKDEADEKEDSEAETQDETEAANDADPLELDANTVDLRAQYAHRGLQVIVKLANIHLTPEKPEYSGGTWHVEGQMNEHIVATALYYYDNENIEPSHLSFRQQVITDIDVGYPQNEDTWLSIIFGCQQDGPAVQNVGSVLCSEGRLLTFPNVLQHRVSPFKLADATRNGHRKILALFLVDPNIRVISTANVPPQQRDWWSREFGAGLKLPQELRDRVVDMVDDFPIGMEEAKEKRKELMQERGLYVTAHEEAFVSNTFSLCEH